MKERVFEIRGRNGKYKVWYPAEDNLASPVPVYDKEGVYKETLWCGGPNGGMTETHFEGTKDEAIEYAQWLHPGCTVRVVNLQGPATRARKGQDGADVAQDEKKSSKGDNPFLVLEKMSEGPKVNLCRRCNEEIPPTGKKGRPKVYHDECRP